MSKSRVLLIGILIFFLATRLYKITEVPVSLYWDEASIGFNAYSMLSDGKDEWGKSWPLHFRAFGEFKLPVYIYNVAIVESVFGLSELSVRLPAVMFSFGTILITYLLTLKIIKNESAALLSAFFLSISPWFFIFSRVGYEVSAGLMFYLLGLYLFLSISQKNIFIIFSSISFLLSMYSYNGFRIIVPLTLPLLFLFILKIKILQSKRFIIAGLVATLIFGLAYMPILRFMKSEDGNARLQSVGIFNNTSNLKETSIVFLNNYLSHFSFDFLFLTGDKNLRSHTTGIGQLYILDLLILVLGVISILFFNKRKDLKDKLILTLKNPMFFMLLGILLISFIPAAITKESPHALRSLTFVPFLSIVLASAIISIEHNIKNKKFFYGLIISSYLILFSLFYSNFMNDYKIVSSADWQFGYKSIFQNYSQEFNKFNYVVVSDEYAQPYIFALFYLHYNPEKFRTEVKYNSVDKWGISKVANFNNFIFENVTLDKIPVGRSLVFASPKEKITSLIPKDQIMNLDGSVAFYIYEINK